MEREEITRGDPDVKLRRLRKQARPHKLRQRIELAFEVTQERDCGFYAECLSENIFTQGDTWEAVRSNVQEAVRAS